jgi:hypothetical protein
MILCVSQDDTQVRMRTSKTPHASARTPSGFVPPGRTSVSYACLRRILAHAWLCTICPYPHGQGPPQGLCLQGGHLCHMHVCAESWHMHGSAQFARTRMVKEPLRVWASRDDMCAASRACWASKRRFASSARKPSLFRPALCSSWRYSCRCLAACCTVSCALSASTVCEPQPDVSASGWIIISEIISCLFFLND